MSNKAILTINAGSSSVKFALFETESVKKAQEAAVQNIGQPSARLVTSDGVFPVDVPNHAVAAQLLIEWVGRQTAMLSVEAIGHRIVHGGPKYHGSLAINGAVLADLRELAPFDPEHLPVEIQLIEVLQRRFPGVKQVACFDTAFHHDLPMKARLLPIPRRFTEEGLRRYGFHGLSYAFIVEELRRVEGEAATNGKVIIAHLGSGASLAALRDGRPIDTTMSLTPASGVPMSTRAGDIDPGLALYFARTEGYDTQRFNKMVNFESGLLGMSETTADMEKLLEIEDHDERAKDAVDVFCYQVKKSIGSLAAALGGINTLVFTGGMGENAPKIRERICEGLGFLGIALDSVRNNEGQRLISSDGSATGVHVIHTDESVTIARETNKCIEDNR
jgi:acetate kinase